MTLKNWILNKLDDYEKTQDYAVATDTVRCWIEEWEELETYKKVIVVDTNGDKYKGQFSQQLFDLITPRVQTLITECGIVFENVDWVYSLNYSGESLHCIYCETVEEGYTSANEFAYMVVDFKGWEDFLYCTTLSELCDDLAQTFEIKDWKVNY